MEGGWFDWPSAKAAVAIGAALVCPGLLKKGP
jgi:hypothetical protein